MAIFHHINITILAKDSAQGRAEFSELGLELPPGKKVPEGELVTIEVSEDDPRWEKMKEKVEALVRAGMAADLRLRWPWEEEVRRLRNLKPLWRTSQVSELDWLEGYAGQTVEQLIALEGKCRTDSLILAFEQAISQKAENTNNQGLTDAERVILAVEALEREVNNGGYDQFFTNSSREFASSIVDALRSIGCKKTATITQRAIKALGVSDLTAEAIDTAMARDDEQLVAKLNRCDDSYYKNAEPIADRLFAFIKANKADIGF